MLNLSRMAATRQLHKWVVQLNRKGEKGGWTVDLESRMPVGYGQTSFSCKSMVGTRGLSDSLMPLSRVCDYNFILVGVGLFHEVAHCVQMRTQAKHIDDLRARIAVCGNEKYYKTGWREFPHEVDAERTGVMNMWDAMDKAFPGKADACMVAFLEHRAKNTSYILRPEECAFKVPSRLDYTSDETFQEARTELRISVIGAFNAAYKRSLDEHREPQSAFRRYPDDVSRLLCEDNRVRPAYAGIFDRLSDEIPGREKDRMMASLTLYLHPELASWFVPEVLAGLTPEETFGRSMPESALQARTRLGIVNGDSDAKAGQSEQAGKARSLIGAADTRIIGCDEFSDDLGDLSGLEPLDLFGGPRGESFDVRYQQKTDAERVAKLAQERAGADGNINVSQAKQTGEKARELPDAPAGGKQKGKGDDEYSK